MEVGYEWARAVAGRSAATVGDLAVLLRVGRHAARRRLIATALPYKIIKRVWRTPDGRVLARRCISIPMESIEVMYRTRLIREWNRNPFGLPDDPVPVPRVFVRKLNKALARARKIPAGQLRAK